jgi:hypothetical protein
MRELTFREAVVEALDIAMGRDPRIFLLGEDIGYYGGLFQATQGLLQNGSPTLENFHRQKSPLFLFIYRLVYPRDSILSFYGFLPR